MIRIFPVKRGLFENNVASFWCVLHNAYKVKFIYDQPTQIKIATVATISACLPSILYLIRSPNNKQFLFALYNVSMAFFMFSFHVHEKQILLPLLFFGLLVQDFRYFFSLFVTVTNFSMAKLYGMDKNYMSYPPLIIGFHYFAKKLEACIVNDFKVPKEESGIIVYNENYKI